MNVTQGVALANIWSIYRLRGKEPARMGLGYINCSYVKMAPNAFACLWAFVFGFLYIFFHDLHVFVSLHTHICLSVWVMSLCFPTHLGVHLLVHLHLSLNACMCLYMTCVWTGRFACASAHISFGFLYKDAITCICMSLEISNSNETSDISQMPGKPKVKSDAGNGWAGPLLRLPLAQQLFSSKMKSAVFQGPLLAASSNLDLHGPLSVHF